MTSSILDDLEIHSNKDVFGPGMSNDGLIKCVFSSSESMKIGTGTTTRRHVSKLYWYIEDIGEETFSCRQINSHYVPAGDEKIISLNELAKSYVLEIEFWEEKTIPAMNQLEDLLDEGEADRLDGKMYSAEQSFQKARVFEEKNVRALFNLGLIYLEIGDRGKAKDMMAELLKLQTLFEGKDQHLFNEFGISLRKSEMFDEAVDYYVHALQFVKTDENLYYNLARANYERGKWEECVDALERCRELNPMLVAADELISLILTFAHNPHLCERHSKPFVSSGVVERIQSVFTGTELARSKDGTPPSNLLDFSHVPKNVPGGRARSGSE